MGLLWRPIRHPPSKIQNGIMDRKPKIFRKESITVAFMVEQLQRPVGVAIEAVNEVDATQHLVTESNLNRPAIVLTGFVELFTYQRVQILGNTETRYLVHLAPKARREAFEHLIQFDILSAPFMRAKRFFVSSALTRTISTRFTCGTAKRSSNTRTISEGMIASVSGREMRMLVP